MTKIKTSFSIVANGARELSGCDSSAEVEMQRAEGEEMTSRDIPTLLAILACVLVATALTGWLSMRAIDYFLPGG